MGWMESGLLFDSLLELGVPPGSMKAGSPQVRVMLATEEMPKVPE